MREPAFWWRKPGAAAALLAPVAAIYGTIAAARLGRSGVRAGVPVLCIGNPTLGGAGKTPLALTLAQRLAAAGERPVFLSRGYGGRLAGPLTVDPARHPAADVGDEPLLLARVAPTVIARERVKGAEAAAASGASVIVMDDGFQNPALRKDCSILVVDAGRLLGNGRVFPAGPLRAPIAPQFARADALVVIAAAPAVAQRKTLPLDPHRLPDGLQDGLPVFHARFAPDAVAVARFAGRRVLAFAGIGDPGKFFATLAGAGIAVAATRSFPDHHRYTHAQARALCQAADRDGLVLATTEKDVARLQGDADVAELAGRACALPVTLVLDNEPELMRLVHGKLAAGRARQA